MVQRGPNKIQEAQFCSSGDYGWEGTNYWQSPDDSLYFKANDDNLNFDNRGNLADANDNYSSGLLFFGSAIYNKEAPFSRGLF